MGLGFANVPPNLTSPASCPRFKPTPCFAFGVIPYWYVDTKMYETAPVVYVSETDSLVAETGCGSGSIALALWLRELSDLGKDFAIYIKQPSGSLYDISLSGDQPARISLGGEVVISS